MSSNKKSKKVKDETLKVTKEESKKVSKKKEEDVEVVKPVKKKKKMTTAQRNKIIMQIAAWAMALIMILGVIAGFLAYLI